MLPIKKVYAVLNKLHLVLDVKGVRCIVCRVVHSPDSGESGTTRAPDRLTVDGLLISLVAINPAVAPVVKLAEEKIVANKRNFIVATGNDACLSGNEDVPANEKAQIFHPPQRAAHHKEVIRGEGNALANFLRNVCIDHLGETVEDRI